MKRLNEENEFDHVFKSYQSIDVSENDEKEMLVNIKSGMNEPKKKKIIDFVNPILSTAFIAVFLLTGGYFLFNYIVINDEVRPGEDFSDVISDMNPLNDRYLIDKQREYVDFLMIEYNYTFEEANAEAFQVLLEQVALVTKAIKVGIEVSEEEVLKEVQEMRQLLESGEADNSKESLQAIQELIDKLGISEEVYWNEYTANSYRMQMMIDDLISYERTQNPNLAWEERRKEIIDEFEGTETEQIINFLQHFRSIYGEKSTQYEGTVLKIEESSFLIVQENVDIEEELSIDVAWERFGGENLISFSISGNMDTKLNIGDKIIVWSSGEYLDTEPRQGRAISLEVID